MPGVPEQRCEPYRRQTERIIYENLARRYPSERLPGWHSHSGDAGIILSDRH